MSSSPFKASILKGKVALLRFQLSSVSMVLSSPSWAVASPSLTPPLTLFDPKASRSLSFHYLLLLILIDR
nr:hypothetical protein [Tanacetum cinerariifolium]